MAYNKLNYYKRIIEIQEITLEKQKVGIPNTRIYKDYIKDRYLIADSTFKRYLAIPAKRELKKLEKKIAERKKREEEQLTMFSELINGKKTDKDSEEV